MANWEKIGACCFGEISNDDRYQRIGNLRRMFNVDRRSGLAGLAGWLADKRRRCECGDPIAEAENLADNSSDDSDCVDLQAGPEHLRPLDYVSQGGIEPQAAPRLYPMAGPAASTMLSLNLPATVRQRDYGPGGEEVPVYFTESSVHAPHIAVGNWHSDEFRNWMMVSAKTPYLGTN
jgi:hypothetical protein